MCRSSVALYTWCHCQETQMVEPCHSGELSASGSCDSVASETVQLYCYCPYHSEKGFLSAHKDKKKQRRQSKREEKRRSFGSTTSVETFNSGASDSSTSSVASSMRALPLRLKKGWNNLRRLSFDH